MVPRNDRYRIKRQDIPNGCEWYMLHWNLVGGLEHFIFSHILAIIIPIDFNIFQRGSNHQPECHFVCSLDMLYYKIYCCAAGCAKSPCHGEAPKHVVWLYVNIGNQWSVLIFPVKLRFFFIPGHIPCWDPFAGSQLPSRPPAQDKTPVYAIKHSGFDDRCNASEWR